MKINNLKWRQFLLIVCLVLTVSSCSKDEFREDVVNDVHSIVANPHLVTIDEAEKQLVALLTEIEGVKTRSGEIVPQRKIANRYSSSFSSGTRSVGSEVPSVHIFNFEDEKRICNYVWR